jgi:hypothetical protein
MELGTVLAGLSAEICSRRDTAVMTKFKKLLVSGKDCKTCAPLIK